MNKRIGHFMLSPELLIDALNLPPCTILGVEWDLARSCIKVYFGSVSDEIEEVEQGQVSNEYYVISEKVYTKFEKVEQ